MFFHGPDGFFFKISVRDMLELQAYDLDLQTVNKLKNCQCHPSKLSISREAQPAYAGRQQSWYRDITGINLTESQTA